MVKNKTKQKTLQSVTERDHRWISNQERGDRNFSSGHVGMLFTGLFLLAFLVCFHIAPKTAWPAMATPIMDWAFCISY